MALKNTFNRLRIYRIDRKYFSCEMENTCKGKLIED